MSIYTYKQQKAFCDFFNLEYYEDPCISDQELDKIPEDSILGGTDYVSGLVWITDGKDNIYIDPKEKIPEGWRRGRTVDHMYTRDPEQWSKICKKSAKRQWENNAERKKSVSDKMRNTWREKYEDMAEKARKNGRHGLFGKLSHNALLLEYKGVEYYGWRELREATGVSKDLYKKYYLNGIDPEPRIGKNGPAPSTSTTDKVRQGGSA